MMSRKQAAFTLLEIMIVVSVIGLLAAIAIPRFVKARNGAQRSVCVNNLRQIDSAKTMYALEDGKGTGEQVEPSALDPFLKKPFDAIIEPASGQYQVRDVGLNPLCSIGGEHTLDPHADP